MSVIIEVDLVLRKPYLATKRARSGASEQNLFVRNVGKSNTLVALGCRVEVLHAIKFASLPELEQALLSQLSYLVDPASSHMLVSKIKPCMSKYKPSYGETANGSLNQLWFLRSSHPTRITVENLELIRAYKP